MDSRKYSSEDYAALLEQVLEVSSRMSQNRVLAPLLEYVMQQAVELTGGEHGYLVLITTDGGLDFRVTHGTPDEPDEENNTPVSRSIINRVIESGKPELVHDAFGNSDFQNMLSVVRLRIRSVLCVPLEAQGELLGVIYIENREVSNAFYESDIPLMMIFASQAAVSIKNAQLNEQQAQLMEHLEEKVQERTAELEQSRLEAEIGWTAALEENRLRTALLGNITHDLRSPLNIVVNTLELIRTGELGDVNELQAEWSGRSLQAVQQVLRLVNDIFDLSKLEQGKLDLFPKQIEIPHFAEQTMTVISGLKRRDSVDVFLDIEPELPLLWADPDRLQQIIINLFSNAFKFTDEGSVTLKIEYFETLGSIFIQGY